MSILLATFLISLLLITIMIGRKIILGAYEPTERIPDFAINVPETDELKRLTHKKLKKISYFTLVITLRIYLLLLDLVKRKYRLLMNKIGQIRRTKGTEVELVEESKKVNSFLKRISDYKTRINKIKRIIKEEEGLN